LVAGALSERIVGREQELARLHQFLDADESSARTLVFSGGPGFGKTALWEVGIEASRRRAVTLTARPSEPEAKLPFAALGDLLETLDGAVFTALPAPQRHALEVALLRAEPSGRPPEARAIAAGFLGVLRELASPGPLVVAVDDLQWIDPASAAALQFAHRRLDHDAITFLLTERTDFGTGTTVRLGGDAAERVELAGLSLRATGMLLAERLDFHPSRMLLRRIFESTGGNPLFALELARTLAEADQPVLPDQPLAVPSELRMFLGQKLAKLPRAAMSAALGAALTFEPSTGLVDALLGADAPESLAALLGAGVVEIHGERIRFTHPLMASTVTAAALPRQRRAMHGELAHLVGDPVASARHLARAAVEPNSKVARTLEDAADLARIRGGWDTAAELLERSLELTPPEGVEDRTRRTVAAAEHFAYAGDRARARGLMDALLATSLAGRHRADALRVLAEVALEDENFEGACTAYEEALEYAADPQREGAIEVGLAYAYWNRNWDVAAGVHAHRALEVAEACGDEAVTGSALAVCAMVDFLLGRGADWDKIARALSLERVDAFMSIYTSPSTIAALLHVYRGDHEEAREGLRAVRKRVADRGGQERDLAWILIWQSWLETRSGDLRAAGSIAEEALDLAALSDSESVQALALAQRALVAAYLGDAPRARDLAAAARDFEYMLPVVWACKTIALVELSLSNTEGAWRACEQMTVALEAHGIGEPIIVFFLPDAIEALIELGELDRAAPLVSSLGRRGRELDRPWALATAARCEGLLLAARDDLAGSNAALTRALIEHDRLDMPFERARTVLAKGVVERRARQRANARASLAEALETFEHMGARLWAERARQELSRVSGRRAGRAGELTPTERQAAELAAEGRSNKEIAEALFVSVHTVESHLSHAYAKLGVRSRSQLAHALEGLS